MEKALGIPVVRHITKKPAGDAVDLEKHFRSAAQLTSVACCVSSSACSDCCGTVCSLCALGLAQTRFCCECHNAAQCIYCLSTLLLVSTTFSRASLA